jgi:hypothetical protein|tara:strand:- start:326 stop:460 length:135 start_codon:yes stop_codon:yes gene_type:complete
MKLYILHLKGGRIREVLANRLHQALAAVGSNESKLLGYNVIGEF